MMGEPSAEKTGGLHHLLLPCSVTLVIFILYGIGFVSPTIFTWGFDFYGVLPRYCYPATIILIAITGLVLLRKQKTSPAGSIKLFTRYPARSFILLSLIFIGVSYLLRVRAPLLGDGFFLVKNFSDAFHGTAPIYFRDEPIATGYFWLVFNIFGFPSTYQGFLEGYSIAEVFLEAGFLVLVYSTLRFMTDDPTARQLGFLSVLAMPTMQLFFGYIETYSVTLFVLSLYIFLAVLTLRGKIPFWVLPPCFLFLFLTHYLNSLLLPSLLYVAYREVRSRGWHAVAAGFGIALSMLFFILIAIGFDIDPFTTTVPHHHYLPLMPSTYTADAITEAYTLFSPYHFNDLLNYGVLMGLPLLCVIPFLRRGDRIVTFVQRDMNLFFLFSFAMLACGLVILKFDLGAIRDWDVFAAYFFTVPLFLTVRAAEGADTGTSRSLLFIIVVLLLHSAAFWLVNADTDATIRRFSTIFDKRTLSHGACYTASLNLAQYYHQIHEDENAIDVWKKFQADYPDDIRVYENLISNYEKLSPSREADIEDVYTHWIRSIPQDTLVRQLYRNYCVDRGNTCFQNGDLSHAGRYYLTALSIDSTYASALNNLGSVYAQLGNSRLAETFFRRALSRNGSYGEAMFNLGMVLADQGNTREAKEYLRRAAALHIEQAQQNLDSLNHQDHDRNRKR